jgi:hypothetical protein
MSKLFSSSANLRRHSRKETSLAPRKPTKKKSLSSSRSTRSSRNPKGSGKPKTMRNASLSTAALTQLANAAEIAINGIVNHPVDHLTAYLKMSLFAKLAANIRNPDALHQVIDWLYPGPTTHTGAPPLGPLTETQFREWSAQSAAPKPWQHEG